MTRSGIATATALALAVAGGVGGCAAGGTGTDGTGTGGTGTGGTGTRITVFAAASLTDVIEQLAARYEAEHPGTQIVLSSGGSSALAAQIIEGAPADVFAAADQAAMQRVVDAGLVADAVVVTTNTLQLAVPAGNPAGVTGLADLADASLVVVLCDPEVPCGAAAQRLFELAGVDAVPDTLDPDVRAVLTRIRLGEADAGLVYRTDVIAAGAEVEGIEVPGADRVVNRYPVAVLEGADDPDAARDWIGFLQSPEAQRVLADAGFVAP